jgi:RimJ/RimL family protein N-acetyltransferase
MKVIVTDRLILRTWHDTDIDAYWRINQDSEVIELVREPMSRKEAEEFTTLANQQFATQGYTLWAAEEKASGKLTGFIGLNAVNWKKPFGPAVEIGWRLGREFWQQGYATEGATAVLEFGFTHCGLQEIIAFTVPQNKRSIRVMEKIGMHRDMQGDFAHPKLPPDHKLSKHVLYKIKKADNNIS